MNIKVDQRVGFVGLGNMGSVIAERFVTAGFALTVYDKRPELVAKFEALGASGANSPAEVAARSDMIGICVSDDAQTLDVVGGGDGLLRGTRSGSIVLIHSTIHPDTCREVDSQCSSRGVSILDAPVSVRQISSAVVDLTLMMGGDAAVISRCDAYLSAIGSHRFHVGSIGDGSTAKLANQVMAILAILATYEGLNVARSCGIDVGAMVDVSMVSSGQSEMLHQWRVRAKGHDGDNGGLEGVGQLGRKDLRHALTLARSRGVDLPVVAAVLELMEQSLDHPTL